MEPQFVNHTKMDKATCRSFLALSWPRNAGTLRIVMLATAIFAIVYGVLQLVVSGLVGWTYAAGMALMGAAALFLAQYGYLLRLNQYVVAQQKAWGSPTLDKEVLFYENFFVQKTRLGEIQFSYKKLTKINQNKTAMLLWMNKEALLLNKNGFIRGNPDEFRGFIRDKIKGK